MASLRLPICISNPTIIPSLRHTLSGSKKTHPTTRWSRTHQDRNQIKNKPPPPNTFHTSKQWAKSHSESSSSSQFRVHIRRNKSCQLHLHPSPGFKYVWRVCVQPPTLVPAKDQVLQVRSTELWKVVMKMQHQVALSSSSSTINSI